MRKNIPNVMRGASTFSILVVFLASAFVAFPLAARESRESNNARVATAPILLTQASESRIEIRRVKARERREATRNQTNLDRTLVGSEPVDDEKMDSAELRSPLQIEEVPDRPVRRSLVERRSTASEDIQADTSTLPGSYREIPSREIPQLTVPVPSITRPRVSQVDPDYPRDTLGDIGNSKPDESNPRSNQKYLGNWSANPLAPNSTSAPGNEYSADGVTNPNGTYGSPYSGRSSTNPYTTQAPKLYDSEGKYRGKLSTNPYDPDSVSNPHGRYGSPYSPDSVNNPLGAGSRLKRDSPNNRLGTGLQIYGEE
jgi:hypothetical protein